MTKFLLNLLSADLKSSLSTYFWIFKKAQNWLSRKFRPIHQFFWKFCHVLTLRPSDCLGPGLKLGVGLKLGLGLVAVDKKCCCCFPLALLLTNSPFVVELLFRLLLLLLLLLWLVAVSLAFFKSLPFCWLPTGTCSAIFAVIFTRNPSTRSLKLPRQRQSTATARPQLLITISCQSQQGTSA